MMALMMPAASTGQSYDGPSKARRDKMTGTLELIYLLVSLDKQFTAEAPGEPWQTR
jgi:hypothetical protein